MFCVNLSFNVSSGNLPRNNSLFMKQFFFFRGDKVSVESLLFYSKVNTIHREVATCAVQTIPLKRITTKKTVVLGSCPGLFMC